MKNSFTIEVCFNRVPLKPYEWDNMSFISGISVTRVNSKCLFDLMTYEGSVYTKNKIILLSDTKNSIALKLNNKGEIVKRSFLDFDKDEDICEYASNIKPTNLDYEITDKKLIYPSNLIEETKMKEYLIKSIKSLKDEDKTKYLYYLYFNDIKDYSKEKLIKTIKNSEFDKCDELYKFLIEN